MSSSVRFFSRACVLASVLSTFVSCKDSDDFFSTDERKTPVSNSNRFDFSTTREVDLIVDYSDFNANVPVFFSVYNTNPFVNEMEPTEYIDPNIKPIFSGYTGKDGKFDETVTLPAYAKRLHIVTGNFLVGLRRTMVLVDNGMARAIVKNPKAAQKARATRSFRAPGVSTSTRDLSAMSNLYQSFAGKQYYKEWATPLGTWSSTSGRPDYLLWTSADDKPAYLEGKTADDLIAKGLVFTEEEANGMYATACAALNSGTNLKEEYRAAADMTLIRDAEISITAMGSSTCWNSSLGYYYYTGDAPTNKMDLNIIMIFPNTQDGEWPRGNYPNNDYKGNIGTLRGDVVQLMYYPPKDDGSLDYDNGTTMFPQGTKIGFILKCNSWGARGADYAVNGTSYAKKKNIWAASTEGLSTALDGGTCPNPNGEARSAKFAYTAPNGKKYVVVSFEDACDDKDYDDLMFALNPSDAFDFNDTPEIESRQVVTEGVYAFEDMWPAKGDFDMNDVMVHYKKESEFYLHKDGSVKLNMEKIYLTTYQNYVDLTTGLAVDLQVSDLGTLYVNKILKGQTDYASTDYKVKKTKVIYALPEFGWDSNESRMWYLTDDITKNLGTTYVFEVTYSKAVNKSQVTVKPFLYRKQKNGKQWELHLPWEPPTSKADLSLLGTVDDKSDPTVKKKNGQKMYYVGDSLYPFAFYMDGVSIDQFLGTILQRANESKPIDTFFPGFVQWSLSEGVDNTDWYLHPVDVPAAGQE